VLAISGALLAFGLVRGHLPDSPLFETLRRHLGLEYEMNLPTWWSAAQLFLAGALMYEIAGTGPPAARGPWLVLAALSVALSIDEVGSLHERVGSGGWGPLIPIGAAIAVAVGWAVLRLVREHHQARAAGLIVLAYALFVGVAGMEEVEERLLWRGSSMYRLAIEEGTELLAFFLLLTAVIGARAGAPPGPRAMIPDPARLRFLPALLLLGLAVHTLVALLVVPALPDLAFRGNPGAWYPAAVYGLLACAAGWTVPRQDGSRRRAWAWLALVFLVGSVGAVWDLVSLAPGIHRVLPRWSFYGVYATYIYLIPPLLLLGAVGLRPRSGRLAALGVGFAALLALRLWIPDYRIDAVTPGLVAYLWSLVFLRPETTSLQAP
jgi:hypothetical protein